MRPADLFPDRPSVVPGKGTKSSRTVRCPVSAEASPATGEEALIVDAQKIAPNVEFEIGSVRKLDAVPAAVSVDLDDRPIGIVPFQVVGDAERNDALGYGRPLGIDLGPLAPTVEFQIGTVFEQDVVRIGPASFAVDFDQGDPRVGKMGRDEFACRCGQFLRIGRPDLVSRPKRAETDIIESSMNRSFFMAFRF